MKKINAKELLEKYTAGLCTEEEMAMVENWYLILREDADAPSLEQIADTKMKIWDSLPVNTYQHNNLSYTKYFAVAAALIVCLSLGLYFSSVLRQPSRIVKGNSAQHDFAPGGNKATLTLANGREIILDDAGAGTIAEQSGITITKTAGGQLVYTVTGLSGASADAYNTIVTPKGGQYQISLPDGTRVWLNASSSLKFPTAFTKTVRKVEMSGEAYFEVAKNPNVPFQVSTGQQSVLVLGTHFNINSYSDEPATKTTLFEGAVKITANSSSLTNVLKPGQQSAINNGMIEVSRVDMDEVLAWKNGVFIFDNEELESIMRKVSRWYNVSIVYKDNDTRNEIFGGSVSRFGNVSELLRMLEITGNVHFRIEADRIVVMKK